MSSSDTCVNFKIDANRVKKVKAEMKSDEIFFALSETYKALGDPTRLKMLYALLKEELCVCELTELLGMSQSAISHQLRVLRNMRLVKYRKEGRAVFYSLDDEHINQLFIAGLDHVEEE